MIPIRDTLPRRNTPIATWLLILVNAVVFLFELTMSPEALEQFFHLFGIVPARFTHPDWAVSAGLPGNDYWPFLTSMFLHGGWLHIIGNMWALWIFGDNVEEKMGPVRFVIFYLVCGLIAGIVHTFTNADSTIPTVGASGAIAGVMGAYFFLFPYARIVVLIPIFFFPFFFEVPAVIYLGFWALSQVFSGTLSLASEQQVGGVAWWAHVGGFIGGIVLQFFLVRRGRAYRRLSRDEYGLAGAWPSYRFGRQYR
jgi:membrane associated rhomboid family serine protease